MSYSMFQRNLYHQRHGFRQGRQRAKSEGCRIVEPREELLKITKATWQLSTAGLEEFDVQNQQPANVLPCLAAGYSRMLIRLVAFAPKVGC